jgi:hypothetical protein
MVRLAANSSVGYRKEMIGISSCEEIVGKRISESPALLAVEELPDDCYPVLTCTDLRVQ